MKIEDVLSGKNAADSLPALQRKVAGELNKRKDEVFTYSDPDFKRVFPDVKESAVNWTLWALYGKGQIDKYKVKGRRRMYFGSHTAIKELKRRSEAENSHRPSG